MTESETTQQVAACAGVGIHAFRSSLVFMGLDRNRAAAFAGVDTVDERGFL